MAGSVSNEVQAEPNLTPLLDVVLQLLMFFVLCADFKRADRKNPAVDLPPSQSAVARSPGEKDVISVNLRAYRDKDYARVLSPEEMDEVKRYFPAAYRSGSAERAGEQIPSFVVPRKNFRMPMNLAQFASWLKSTAEENRKDNEKGEKEAAAKNKKFKPVELVINIRAEEGIQYEHVYKIRALCQEYNIKSVTVSVKTINRGAP